ncbi:hypothetical protein EW145_g1571 [Phellinidium pouzarii]|uniref:SSD domain-containing protein n=1 Tax=Phellinidium pouzarii TaxID=167371 RepID=A0A4S4LE98_9AGAM|nr:hypothetical protein EW145_g1571 [Phellinidium pouzarii]
MDQRRNQKTIRPELCLWMSADSNSLKALFAALKSRSTLYAIISTLSRVFSLLAQPVATISFSHDNKLAVKSLAFYVGESHASGFFDSCKEVKLSAANDYAMTFIGGGAKDASAFLKFLGDEKDIGSPFQIDFSYSCPPEFLPYDPPPRNCSDNDLQSRCTCVDCSDVCQALPPVTPPDSGSSCHVGRITCLSFILTDLYAIMAVGCILIYTIGLAIRRRNDKGFERTALPGEDPSDNPLSPRSHSRSLLGASSLTHGGGDESARVQSGDSRNLGRGASLLDPIETLQPRQYRLNTFLRRSFYRIGLMCASYPWLTFTVMFATMGLLNIGWKYFEVETDPVRLWVAPNSESKLQKEFFDQNFGPFYRPQQIFITSTAPSLTQGSGHLNDSHDSLTLERDLPPVLSYDHLKWWFSAESDIRALRSPNGYELSDICYKPSGPGTACVVQSITAWFDYDLYGYEEYWKDQIMQCSSAPADCLPDFGQPLGPQYVLGGLPNGLENVKPEDYLDARALVVTIVIDDSLDSNKQEIAMEWERTLRKHLQNLKEIAPHEAGLDIHFSTGVSLEEEINKSTNTDVTIVVLSYVVMFFYVALSLGSSSIALNEEGVISSTIRWTANLHRYFRNKLSTSSMSFDSNDDFNLSPRLPTSLFVNSKFTLGLFGIVLVILSVSSSVGLFSFAGVKVTLIIAEVIPFLVLAVGVDNVFILVHELDRQNLIHGPNAPANPQNIGVSSSASVQVRPSPFSSSQGDSVDAVSVPLHFTPEERVARTLAKMGPSILLSSITEVTAFALGALVPMPAVRNFALYAAGSVFLNAILQITVFISALTVDLHRVEASRSDCFPCIKLSPRIALLNGPLVGASIGNMAKFIRRRYAPFLLRPVVKGIVLLLFGGLFFGSVISIQHIQLGLDQRLALPSDSYLISYFDALESYLDIGPPVYFVARDVNVTERIGQRHLCGRFTTCDGLSLANILEAERKRPESSFINQPAASWIDDYLHWLDPANSCCRVRRAKPDVFCSARDSSRLCRPCLEGRTPAWNITMDGLPEGDEFMRYLQQWLHAPANEDCALGGQAAYSTALSLDSDSKSGISASHFRTFHAPLKTQADFINSLNAAQRIASDISERTGVSTFPYSIHYVFFDQYIHIVAITQEILGLGLAAVLVITALLLGSWRTGTIVTSVVALTVTSVMGIMGIWGISLNAISLVNLVISLGIAVEFCAHIARAFMGAGTGLPVDQSSRQKERDERMWAALVDVGPSVLSGITFTKLIGVSVLALTRSKLLEIYYFRMWLALIVSGALHGLVLLPVVLSYAGGPGYALEDADEEWMSTTVRRDYEYTPFLADDDSIHSD